MRVPDLFAGNAERVAEAEVVAAPAWNMSIEQALEFLGRPGGSVDTIRDGVDWVTAKELSRRFPMAHRDTVHVMAEAQAKLCHVQEAIRAAPLLDGEYE
jgi:hypothetical protein